MFYLGYDFSSHSFCITKKESRAVEFCFYNRNAADPNDRIQRKTYPLYEMDKEAALKHRDDMNDMYRLSGEDDHYDSGNSWGTIKKCAKCGRPFFFPDPEKKFYESHGLPEPVRCGHCRSERKKKKEKKNG